MPQRGTTELRVRLLSDPEKIFGSDTGKNMYEPIERPYAAPNARLSLAGVCVWHVAHHYGRIVIYRCVKGMAPLASRANRPQLHDKY